MHQANRPPAAAGVLLVGHGTRDAEGLRQFSDVAERVAQRLSVPLEACFLELAEPNIAAGLRRLVERGAQRVIVAPLLLFAAGHARDDIPQAVQAAASEHPEVTLSQAAPLGCHGLVLELSARRFQESLHGTPAAGDDTLLVLIGRGSSTQEATDDAFRYANLLAARWRVAKTLVGFAAIARPPMDEVLASAADDRSGVVVVQPHFLFYGQLWRDVERRVNEMSQRQSQRIWRLTAPLGADDLLARGIVERVEECWRGSGAAQGEWISGVDLREGSQQSRSS